MLQEHGWKNAKSALLDVRTYAVHMGRRRIAETRFYDTDAAQREREPNQEQEHEAGDDVPPNASWAKIRVPTEKEP